VHLANKHDWANPAESNRAERAAVETIAETLIGTDRPFVLASGVIAGETEPSPFVGPDSMRGGSENRAFDFIDQGVRAMAARFAPTVHGMRDHGFIAYITEVARRTGVSAYVGDGSTPGPPSTGPTPPDWCGSAWSRRRLGRACTRWRRTASRPA
jgi:hypothetical protein